MSRAYKLVQLNVLNFVYFDSLIEFLNKEDPDIVTFQEVSENNLIRSQKFADTAKYNDKNYLVELKLNTSLKYGEFFKSWGVEFADGKVSNWGVAVFSKTPIIDYSYYYDAQTGNYKLTKKDFDPFFISEDKKVRDVHSMQKPSVFAQVLLELNGKPLKIFTGHFVISDLCTESLQRINQVNNLLNFINSQKVYPTIVAADFNMSAEGESIKIMEKNFEPMSSRILNSLDKSVHPAFNPQQSIRGVSWENLKVDHVFGKDVVYKRSYTIENLGISDHLPIIVEFEL